MSESHPTFIENGAINLACFEVRGQTYALDVLSVCEIVRMQPITPLPNSPSLIEGVIDLRGAVIPIVDLARVLGLGSGSDSGQARIVVLEFEGLLLGVWVDSVTDVLSLDADRLEAVPELAMSAGCDAIRHVVRRDAEPPVMVLALGPLIDKIVHSEASKPASRGAVQ